MTGRTAAGAASMKWAAIPRSVRASPGRRGPSHRTWTDRLIAWICGTVVSYARSNHGGAILVGGAFIIAMMASVGAVMSNYAWREAQ